MNEKAAPERFELFYSVVDELASLWRLDREALGFLTCSIGASQLVSHQRGSLRHGGQKGADFIYEQSTVVSDGTRRTFTKAILRTGVWVSAKTEGLETVGGKG
jgi:hypothetical protein